MIECKYIVESPNVQSQYPLGILKQYFKNPWAKYFHWPKYLTKRDEPHCPKAVVLNQGGRLNGDLNKFPKERELFYALYKMESNKVWSKNLPTNTLVFTTNLMSGAWNKGPLHYSFLGVAWYKKKLVKNHCLKSVVTKWRSRSCIT